MGYLYGRDIHGKEIHRGGIRERDIHPEKIYTQIGYL